MEMENASPRWWRTTAGIVAIWLAAIVAVYLLAEHFGHVFAALPYLLLLACPLMHVMMHRGHQGHGKHGG